MEVDIVEAEIPRDSEEEQNQKKKKKKEKIHVTIETLGEHLDSIPPLVGYFPSGFDPLGNQSANREEQPQHKVRVFRHESRTNRLQLVVRPNGSQIDFVGTSYSGEARAPQVCAYGLGILDKESQTLKIVPIASNKIFRLEPRVGGSDLTEKEHSKEEFTAEKKADKMRDLTLMYSTKKSISQAKKRESLYQKENPANKEDLDRKIDAIKINKEALESASSHNARNIPPHDSAATMPELAYPLEKIILRGEWDYLLDILKLSQDGAVIVPNDYPSFVCNRVHKLEDIQDEEKKRQLACIFSFITHLIKFKDKHSADGFSSAKHHKLPRILLQRFSGMFAESDSKWLLDEKRDLLISYVLVLTLIADDFRTDPSDIAKDLRMTAITLRPHYEYLGCKLVREGKLLLATLPVPLQFRKQQRGKRRR